MFFSGNCGDASALFRRTCTHPAPNHTKNYRCPSIFCFFVELRAGRAFKARRAKARAWHVPGKPWFSPRMGTQKRKHVPYIVEKSQILVWALYGKAPLPIYTIFFFFSSFLGPPLWQRPASQKITKSLAAFGDFLAGWPLPGGPKEGRKEKENGIYREGGLAIKCPNQNL